MDTTIYLNNQLSAEEAAIKIQEEAIKAKKAALRIKKTVDNKLKNTIQFLYEITTNYPDYKEIIAAELKDLLGITSAESETIQQPEETQLETSLLEAPQEFNTQKSYSRGDRVNLGSLSLGENYECYIIEQQPEAETATYNIFAHNKKGSIITSVEAKHLTLIQETNPTKQNLILMWIKNHILNSNSNLDIQNKWNCLSTELKEEIKESMGPVQHNQLLCIKALPTPAKERDPVQEGDEIIYRNPETQEEETGYYIGYYLKGKLLTNKEERSIYLPRLDQGIICERRLLKSTGKVLNPENPEEEKLLDNIRFWLQDGEQFFIPENSYIKTNVSKKTTKLTGQQLTIPNLTRNLYSN